MPGFVYILKNLITGEFYVGSTADVHKRLQQHRNGQTQTTRNRFQSFDTALIQEYRTLIDARKVERKIKKLKRKDYVEKMIKDGYIKIII